MSQTTQPANEWRVVDYDNDMNVRPADSKAKAEDMKAEAEGFGSETVVLVPPGEPLPEDVRDALNAEDTDEEAEAEPDADSEPETDGGRVEPEVIDHTDDEDVTETCGICGDPVSIAEARSGSGGQPIHGDCYTDGNSTGGQATEAVPVEPDEGPETTSADAATDDLPERDVGTDPITWMPSDFVDRIDGSPAVNRKGFEVLAHFYEIDVTADLEVPPEDTGHEYCRVKAVATTPDGRICEAYGSAHVDRGDDKTLLLEMAGTRARKRALSIATGVGAVAVSELKSETKAELEQS